MAHLMGYVPGTSTPYGGASRRCWAHVGLESQILQILGLAALASGAEELMPEGIVVTAGSDRQGHGGTPTEQEHFLPGWS